MGNIMHSQDRPDVLSHVAGNMRRLRAERGLSQAALADNAGLSRRMVVGIETGEANISLANLDRLAEALGVSFSEIVRSPDATDNRRIESLAWRGLTPDSTGKLLGTVPAAREAELWHWSLAEGERYPAETDAGYWNEMLFVVQGTLTVELEDGDRTIVAGDFLIFRSDRPYAFFNGGSGPVRFVRNVVY